jgi:dihydrodipicolinate synthase/N-acetylneuraminate lyase
MRKHPELQNALANPIPSIRTPFRKDGGIDFDGVESYVERCLTNGAMALMLTAGDSLYSLLTDDEVAEMTRFVVERTAGRAAVIAADRIWWTGKSVEFARYCREVGADILMVLPPDWAHSCTPQTLVEHYRAIANEIPVMVVTGYMIPRGISWGLEAIKKVYKEVEGVVAIKDDFCNEFGRRMTAMVSDRWTVIAGGLKQNHFNLAPYGCRGHLSTLIVYKPEIALDYWNAMTSGDFKTAATIIVKYDMPFMEILRTCPGGFDAGMHAWGALCGIYERWRRPPYHSLTDEEMDSLAESLRRIGVL